MFELKYSPNYRIIATYGNNHIAIKAPDSKVQVRRRGTHKEDRSCRQGDILVPSVEDFEKFGRKTKFYYIQITFLIQTFHSQAESSLKWQMERAKLVRTITVHMKS